MVRLIIYLLILNILIAGCREKESSLFTLMPSGKTGIEFSNDIVETEANNIMTYQYMYNGAGVALGDVNNDGLSDIYFAGNSVSNKLYLNKGDWKFEDVTDQMNLSGRTGDWKTGVSMVDINGDGWLDIYVCYSGNVENEGIGSPVQKDRPERANQLFINNGAEDGALPAFTDRAKEYGLDAVGTFSSQSYFFDYDKDGDLDMFLVNHANMFYSPFFNT
ncbi:MAG: VCBS repeat-containing protein, partial [Candidatus Omnitrophica bacterium]|nr:VCBS repeat-containing protein [Candidatus Omnitrophota bacterium]